MVLDPLERYRATAREVPTVLARHGLVMLDGLFGSRDLSRLTRSIATVAPHRDNGLDRVTIIADHGAKHAPRGLAGFSRSALSPHTDRSGITHPPGLLMTGCLHPAATGGESVLIDGQAVFDDLAESEPRALRSFCSPRSALFGGAAGHLGSIFADAGGDRVAVRLRLDDLARFSPDVQRWLPTLRDVIDRHSMTAKLDAGQGYLLDNHRWLHGRRAFIGRRVVYRVAGNPLHSLALPLGFRPTRRLPPRLVA